jgi:hypothetical protein
MALGEVAPFLGAFLLGADVDWGTYLRTFTSATGAALVGAGSKSARIEQSAAGIATTESVTITAMIKSTLAARHRMMATGMITALPFYARLSV